MYFKSWIFVSFVPPPLTHYAPYNTQSYTIQRSGSETDESMAKKMTMPLAANIATKATKWKVTKHVLNKWNLILTNFLKKKSLFITCHRKHATHVWDKKIQFFGDKYIVKINRPIKQLFYQISIQNNTIFWFDKRKFSINICRATSVTYFYLLIFTSYHSRYQK